MPNEPTDPFTFSVQEVADALNVSTDTILRQVHGGALQAIQVGRRVMVLNQSLADVVARHIMDKRDERRKAVDEFDAVLAEDAAANRREDERQRAWRAEHMSAKGQRARAKAQQMEREAREAAEGTLGQRLRTIVLHPRQGRNAPGPVSDADVDVSDVREADPDEARRPFRNPDRPVGVNGRKAYVLDGKVKEVTRPVLQGLGAGERVG